MFNVLLITYLFFISSCLRQNYLKIEVYDSHFYQSNKELIDESIILVQKHCITKQPKTIKIKFDYMPIELINIAQDKVGMTHFMYGEDNLIWIETNIYKFAYQNREERKRYILHEIGHAFGMEHSEKESDLMFLLNSNNKNAVLYFKAALVNHCSQIK
jgi:hypothetical protein